MLDEREFLDLAIAGSGHRAAPPPPHPKIDGNPECIERAGGTRKSNKDRSLIIASQVLQQRATQTPRAWCAVSVSRRLQLVKPNDNNQHEPIGLVGGGCQHEPLVHPPQLPSARAGPGACWSAAHRCVGRLAPRRQPEDTRILCGQRLPRR